MGRQESAESALGTMSKLFNIGGKTALVTGGAKGLGRMIAEGLVEAGCKVYITSRDHAACEQAALEMSQSGVCFALGGDWQRPI
jgi:NAD(P)-dependent dehydrogenase (short-subunit alcohol dehydrogenase family)